MSHPMTIAEAKQALPLETLMEQLGHGEHVAKSARCPFHDDSNKSFSVYDGKNGKQWKCHTGCGVGDQIDYLSLVHGVGKKEATKEFLHMASPSRELPKLASFSWQKYQAEDANKAARCLSRFRGYSYDFCEWLLSSGAIGVGVSGMGYEFAFPITNALG